MAPSFWGLRTERWTYVVYESGERELYDNDADPHQLRNLAGDPRQAETIDAAPGAARRDALRLSGSNSRTLSPR